MEAVSYERRAPGHATRERRQHMVPRDSGCRTCNLAVRLMSGPSSFIVSTRSVSAEAIHPKWGSAIGISSIRHWHRTNRLPRFHRACPSAALDERCQVREVCRLTGGKSRRGASQAGPVGGIGEAVSKPGRRVRRGPPTSRLVSSAAGTFPPPIGEGTKGNTRPAASVFFVPSAKLGGRYRWPPNRRTGVGGHW